MIKIKDFKAISFKNTKQWWCMDYYGVNLGHRACFGSCLTQINYFLTVPGAPKDIVATPINSTTINVRWNPPDDKERNGIIRGYHIHVQEANLEV